MLLELGMSDKFPDSTCHGFFSLVWAIQVGSWWLLKFDFVSFSWSTIPVIHQEIQQWTWDLLHIEQKFLSCRGWLILGDSLKTCSCHTKIILVWLDTGKSGPTPSYILHVIWYPCKTNFSDSMTQIRASRSIDKSFQKQAARAQYRLLGRVL